MNGASSAQEPLMDWSAWEGYRSAVRHPAGYIQAQDIENARENVQCYKWAKEFVEKAEAQVIPYLNRFTPEFLEQMIPANSVHRCYQCPACRDKGLPRHPGGDWGWSLDNPEVIACNVCGTVFPNGNYPETIVLECKSRWGKGQTFSFYGGETFQQWGYAHYRPSFTGMVRLQKLSWCRNMAYRFSLAYALSGKMEYAEVVRKILLRLAKVYPNWLLITTYGEIADMDPHIAGLRLNDLPEDELVYPPNEPDRKIYAGYWATGRVGGGGQEGDGFTRPMLQAYEFTYNALKADGAPLYTEEERIRIERDVILESCVHLIGEKNINNKSVGNRVAVGMVGISLGHPGFVRFGLEGWDLTMETWFLSDGCTPESPAYALMSLHGIYSFPQAVRGYSDPPGYADGNGKRIDDLDLYRGKYKLVWERMLGGLQGDLRYPPYADSYRNSEVGARFGELLAANYPDNPQYQALLRRYAGTDLAQGDAETALFFRSPGLEKTSTPALDFRDNFFPVLCLGQLRAGDHGQRSLALLSATHWGGHHHHDSLNLYYWKDGHELLTDLGYLWDHPASNMTRRTFAHNTGMVDLESQKTKGRDGRFHLFHVGGKVKVMEASSNAYDKADTYRRTVVQVEGEGGDSYLADIFRLQAAGFRDLVYHGPNGNDEIAGIDLQEREPVPGMDLRNTKFAHSQDSWRARWLVAGNMQLSVYHCGQQGEVVYIGDGWGQRDYRNTDLGVTLPYVVRRHRPGAGLSAFCTVYEGHKPDGGLVKSANRVTVPEQYVDNVVALRIETRLGADLIISQLVPVTIEIDTPVGKVRTDARVAVISTRDGKPTVAALAEGNTVAINGAELAAERLLRDEALGEQPPEELR